MHPRDRSKEVKSLEQKRSSKTKYAATLSKAREDSEKMPNEPEIPMVSMMAPRAKVGKKMPVILPRLPRVQPKTPICASDPKAAVKRSFPVQQYQHIEQPSHPQLLKPILEPKKNNYETPAVDQILISADDAMPYSNIEPSNENLNRIDIVFGMSNGETLQRRSRVNPYLESFQRLGDPSSRLNLGLVNETRRSPRDFNADHSLRINVQRSNTS